MVISLIFLAQSPLPNVTAVLRDRFFSIPDLRGRLNSRVATFHTYVREYVGGSNMSSGEQ